MCLSANFYEVTYKGKKTYLQNWRADKWCDYFKNITPIDEFDYKIKNCFNVDDIYIKHGLEKFAEFILSKFKAENVIVYIPEYTKFYLSSDYKVCEYEEKKIALFERSNDLIKEYSLYLAGLLPGCKLMFSNRNNIAYEENSNGKIPASNHYMCENYIDQGRELLKILGIDVDSIVSPMSMTLLTKINLVEQKEIVINDLKKKMEALISNSDKYLQTLNDYFNNLVLDNKLIFISAFDDCSTQWRKFTAKENLGLKEIPELRDSYIAVVDHDNGYIYENKDKKFIEYEYVDVINNEKFYVCSSGFGNIPFESKIVWKDFDYSKRNRGINVVIFSKQSRRVIDSFSVDMFKDEMLELDRRYKF